MYAHIIGIYILYVYIYGVLMVVKATENYEQGQGYEGLL